MIEMTSIFVLIQNSWSILTDKKWGERIFTITAVILLSGVFYSPFYLIEILGILPQLKKSTELPVELIFNIILLLFIGIIILLLIAVLIGIFYNFNTTEKTASKDSFVIGLRLLFPSLFILFLYLFITSIGLILLIIPGIYLTVIYSMSLPVLILEGERGFRALSRSKELTQGFFWSLLLRYFILACLSIVWGFVIYLVPPLFNLIILPAFLVFLLAYQFNLYKALAEPTALTEIRTETKKVAIPVEEKVAKVILVLLFAIIGFCIYIEFKHPR
jgi:hypothetical protein